MRKLLREPLLHFLLLGFGLFLLHGWMAGPEAGQARASSSPRDESSNSLPASRVCISAHRWRANSRP